MVEKYLIGEFSDLSGISKRMLRHYDKLGLFSPLTLNEENGYRYYAENQMADLKKIQFLRDLGFTLSSVSELISKPINLNDFIEKLKEKEVALTKESDEIKSSLLLAKRTLLHLEKQSPQTILSINQLLSLEGSLKMKNEVQNKVEPVDLKQLMNRDLFVEKIEEILEKDQQDDYHLITFDIDHFMHVNDIDGYDVGDSVIQNIVTMIVYSLKPLMAHSMNENLVARLGGDECSVFLKNADQVEVVTYVKKTFENVRAFDFKAIGCSREITISCGIAYGKKPIHTAQLKDQSIKALIEAKRKGRDQYVVMAY